MKQLLVRTKGRADRLLTVRQQLLFVQPVNKDLTETLTEPVDRALTLLFPVEETDIPRLVLEGGTNELEAIKRHVSEGEQLAVILDGQKVACRGLVRTKGMISLEGHRHFRRLQDHQAFIHYCRTAEKYRGRKLYPALLGGILQQLRISGSTRCAIISCRKDNMASIKGITRAGFRLSERTLTVGILGGRLAITRSHHEMKARERTTTSKTDQGAS